jgi:predicted phosphate transport protein (TIGR00153 family)
MFRASKELEMRIDEYLNAVSEGLLVFKEAVKNYLENDHDVFLEHLKTIGKLESKADNLRRNIENDLYEHSLIPEHRGDVLALLENSDEVIDAAKETLNQFDVEKPYIPAIYNSDYIALCDMAVNAGEAVVRANRAFFKEIRAVKDHLHKVYFYEREADSISARIKRKVFADKELDLSQKFHLRYFTLHIDSIADYAEKVADRLSIYSIKRTI